MKKLKTHYSGKLSIKFWRQINKTKLPRRRELYTLGVILQNIENDILTKMQMVWDK